MFSITFLSKENTEIDLSIIGVNIDFNSITFGTEMGKGESDLSLSVYAESNNALVIKSFNQSIKKVLLFFGTTLIWAGIATTTKERPEFDEGQRRLTIRFTGYYELLNRQKVTKVWVDNVANKRLLSPSRAELNTRGILGRQDEGQGDDDGTIKKTILALDDTLLYYGTERFVLQYQAINNYPIQAISGKWWARSGEGMAGSFWNYTYGVRFLNYDVTDTGDQTDLKSITIPQITATGGDTSIIEYRTGTSPSEASSEVYKYGAGTDEVVNTLQGSIGENCLILRFNKTFSKAINDVQVELNATGEYRARAAVYNLLGNLADEFDNEVLLSPGLTNYTFIKNEAMDLGPTTGTYYLVIRIDNTTNDVPITTVGRDTATNPPAGFVVNGYLRHGTLAGGWPNFSATFTTGTPFASTWVGVLFNLDLKGQVFYDQNDYTKLELKVYSKYNPLHSVYLAPAYTAPQLIEDALLEAGGEIVFDASLIPSGINNDLSFDAIGEAAALPLADVLEKIYSVFNGGKLYPQVWAYNNGGTPRFELIQRSDAIINPVYSINTLSQNITVKTNNAVDLINFVFVRFTNSDNGLVQIIGPNKYPSLADGDPTDLGLDRVDYYHDAGEATEAEALQAGEGIIAEFKRARESGTVTIIGPGGVVNFGDFNETMGINPVIIKALNKMVLVGHVAYDGTPDPTYQITKTRYNVGSQTMVLNFGDPEFSQAVFESLKKSLNSNK